mmetsp:Transcript_9974/g.31628  ORF Transcript_9974/g.31628 Transcript_9974/m.31628 type:complete len:158 (+) Transcript_9974:59-532(+)
MVWNASRERMITDLLAAVKEGDVDMLEESLPAARHEIDKRHKIGWPQLQEETLLTWASIHGQALSVQKLLDSGASVHVKNGGGLSAMMIACQRGHLEVVKVLSSYAVVTQQHMLAARRSGHADIAAWLVAKIPPRVVVNRARRVVVSDDEEEACSYE